MTVRLLYQFQIGRFTAPAGAVVALDAATEAGLIAQGLAAATSDQPTWQRPFVDPVGPDAVNFVLGGERFGISPSNADNAPGFAAFAAWLMGASQNVFTYSRVVTLELGPGDYAVDGAVMDLTWRAAGLGTWTPIFTIRGAGATVTRIVSSAGSTAPVMFQILAGYVAHSALEDLSFIARPDVRQDALGIYATRRVVVDNTGGITLCRFRRVGIRSERGDGLVLAGGSDDTLAPNQFLEFDECSMYADRGAAVRVLGQFGQVRFAGGSYGTTGGAGKTIAASASIQMSPDRRFAVNPSEVNTTQNWLRSSLEAPTGTPVRFVGTNLPSGLSAGVTYFLRRFDVANSTTLDQFTVHTTQANLSADTRVALGSAGTLANYWIAPLYISSVGASVLNFEFPHNFPEQKQVQIVGANLPTGLATSTAYWVIRRSATQIALASSLANAQAGTAITFSGGDVTRFALTVPDSAVGAYTVHFDGASIEGCLQGLYAARSGNIVARLHCEENKQSIYVSQTRLQLISGHYANAADDGGAGCLLSASGNLSTVSIDAAPYINGNIDKLLNSTGAAVRHGVSWCREGNNSTTYVATSGLAQQIGVETDGSVIVNGHEFMFVNASATQIINISSRLLPGARLRLMAWGGSIVLNNTGNIVLPNGAAPLTVPQRGVVTLELVDTVGTWALVGRSF